MKRKKKTIILLKDIYIKVEKRQYLTWVEIFFIPLKNKIKNFVMNLLYIIYFDPKNENQKV